MGIDLDQVSTTSGNTNNPIFFKYLKLVLLDEIFNFRVLGNLYVEHLVLIGSHLEVPEQKTYYDPRISLEFKKTYCSSNEVRTSLLELKRSPQNWDQWKLDPNHIPSLLNRLRIKFFF